MFEAGRAYLQRKPEFDRAVLKAMRAGDYIQGSEVKKFERKLKEYLEVNHVIGVANGTDALQIAIMSLNLPQGSEIMLPAYNYIAGKEACEILGFTPVYADVTLLGFNLDPLAAWRKTNPKVKAVIFTHLFGQVVGMDMQRIMNFAERQHLFVIEDCAQSIGTKQPLRGHIGTTSFYPTKNLGCFGDGGAVFTNNLELAKRVRMIANHGQTEKYKHEQLGVNSRLDNMQAAILNVKLKYLDRDNRKRQRIAEQYDIGMGLISDLFLPIRMDKHIYHQYVLTVRSNRRNKLKKYLSRKGIQTEVYYPYSFENWNNNDNAHYLSKHTLALPVHSTMKKTEVRRVINSVKKFFAKK